MPPRPEFDPKHVALNTALITFQGGVALGATTAFSHRFLAHQSVKPNEPGPLLTAVGSKKGVFEVGSRVALAAVAVEPEIWAAPHVIHHKFPDVNMVPFVELGDFLEWADTQPAAERPTIPASFNGLDPDAKNITPDEVRKLAGMVRPLVADLYDAPTAYSHAEVKRLLDPDTPRYFYGYYGSVPSSVAQMTKRGKADWQLAEPRTLLSIAPELRDAHSPVFHRLGVLGIRFTNVAHYMVSSNYFKAKQSPEEYARSKRNTILAQVALFGGNIAAQAFFNKKRNRNLMLGAAAMTGAEIGVGVFGAVLAGGNFTNADGHAGKRRPVSKVVRDVYQAARRPDGNRALNVATAFFRLKPDPKEDGTYTTNTKIWALFSMDEVGGQEDHHEGPWRRAYTTAKRPLMKFLKAPFGTVIDDGLTKHGVLMQPGDQYGHPELAEADEPLTLEAAQSGTRFVRPDEPHIATLTIQKYRIRTLERQGAAGRQPSTP